MKSGNKALLAFALLLIAYLAAGLLLAPRENKEDGQKSGEADFELSTVGEGCVHLVNAQDSISYAVSMMIASDMPRAIRELGITDSTIDNFVKGLCDAFPADESPEAVAYAQGIVVGASAMEMLDEANAVIYQSDTTWRVDNRIFLEGLKAVAYGNNNIMTPHAAYNYYNSKIFRLPSEEFISRNRKRNGVQTLNCGVQVKIERAGSGDTALFGSTVGYIYKASFINGNTYESSRGEVHEAKVNEMLPGLIEVFTTFPVGTKCKVYLPWQLAYGAEGSNVVPPYSAVVYDIEIVKIIKK